MRRTIPRANPPPRSPVVRRSQARLRVYDVHTITIILCEYVVVLLTFLFFFFWTSFGSRKIRLAVRLLFCCFSFFLFYLYIYKLYTRYLAVFCFFYFFFFYDRQSRQPASVATVLFCFGHTDFIYENHL